MRRTFSYTLLITLFVLFETCRPHYVQVSTEMRNLFVSDSVMPVDSHLLQLYLPYKKELEKDMTRVISKTQEKMVKNKPESNLTNFLADLLIEEGERAMSDSLKPDISYFNYGGIRTFLPQGEITVGKIYELMPFENEMVFLLLTGKQVQEFLNHIAASGGDGLGGVRFFISGNKATGVTVGNRPLEPGKDYWLVTNDYIASGGDGLEILIQRKKIIPTGLKIRDAIIYYMERIQQMNELIFKEPDGRISYTKSP